MDQTNGVPANEAPSNEARATITADGAMQIMHDVLQQNAFLLRDLANVAKASGRAFTADDKALIAESQLQLQSMAAVAQTEQLKRIADSLDAIE